MALRTIRLAALAASKCSGRGTACLGTVGCELYARQQGSFSAQASCSSTSDARYTPPFATWPTCIRGMHGSALLSEAHKVNVPAMGESISEGQIAGILKGEGASVKEGDIIAQIETDKVTIDVKYDNKTPGKVTKVMVKDGDTVAVGAAVVEVELGEGGDDSGDADAPPAPKKDAKADSGNADAPPAPKKDAKADTPPSPKKDTKAPAPSPPSPKENKASPAKPAAPPAPAASKPAAGSGLKPAEAPPVPGPGQKPERRVKMTRLRLRVAERLKGAQNTYAMLSTFNEVDMTALMELRNLYKDTFFERHGVKLGFMSSFVKAAAAALIEVPAVNGVIDGDEIVYRDYYDISIAVATPKGLVVPVLRGVDKLNFAGIEKNINMLGKKARDGMMGIDDMAGGTFTISNGGVYGSLLSTPIINPPQSAILGMHAINQRAAVVNGKVEVRPIMNLALTYDHRLIDGREAVTFLKKIKEVVEDPRRLLLDV